MHVRLLRQLSGVLHPIFIWFLIASCGRGVIADVRLPAVLSDHMVLQQNSSAPIWGWADPGETIRIETTWQADPVSTAANANGRWSLRIDTPSAGGPFRITVSGSNTVVLTDVLIGEVWYASGQSNMGMPVGRRPTWKHGILNWEEEVAAANHPDIRLFFVKKEAAASPKTDIAGSWSPCTSESVYEFSAAAYFFARKLHNELNVPIGIFDASSGGSRAAAWMTSKWLESDANFVPILERYNEAAAIYPQALAEYNKARVQWQREVAAAEQSGATPARPPRKPLGPGHPHSPSALFNGMVAPILPYRIRGVIWYQGESNRERGYQYRKLFPALIHNWREVWGQGALPFYYVQIGPFPYRQEPLAAVELREAQRLTLAVPNTGMVVTTDIASPADLHPQNKQDVGKRLAFWALAKTYGRSDIVYSGPLYRRMQIENDRIRLHFDHVAGGLIAKNGARLTHFTIAGADRKFQDADAVIDGDTIVVRSPQVDSPVAVRFGWANDAVPNLFNATGLPASPFATDNWPGITYDAR